MRTPQFKRWAGNWELAKLHSIAKAAWNNKDVKERFDFVPSQRVLSRMQELLGHDVQRLVITSDAIRHIKNHHGEDASRGQISMTPSDIALLPYLINNYDSMELSPEYNDKMGNRAIEIQKRINGLTVIATIEKGNNEHVVTAWQFKKSNALDAPNGTPGLYVRNDFDATKVQQEIDTIKKNLDNSTKVVDENGEPLVVYHGTDGNFNTFRRTNDIGFHFGDRRTARTRIGRSGNLMPVYLDIKNPIRINQDFGSWDAEYMVGKYLVEKGYITKEELNNVLYSEKGYKLADAVQNKNLRELLLSKGYDGIIYTNWYESDSKPSYIAFKPTQVKSKFGELRVYLGRILTSVTR